MQMKFFVLATAILMYALVVAFQEKKVWFSLVTALIFAVCAIFFGGFFEPSADWSVSRVVFVPHHIFGELINWNVLLIYAGSMAIASLFIYSRAPARIADSIIAHSPSCAAAMVLIAAMTGIISIFVENVATLLVMAPIAISLCKKQNLDPSKFILALAVMSNLEGTATLVGDPPSMIFASYAGYTFNDFFFHSGKPSVFFVIQVGLLTGCIFFYFVFRSARQKMTAEKTPIVSLFPSALLILMILGLAAISFLKIEAKFISGLYVFALGVIGILWYAIFQKKSRAECFKVIHDLDWETIAFLTGIFVVVGAVSETGLLDDLAAILFRATGGSELRGFILILAVSVLLSGFIDNVPYIIVMLPVAATLAQKIGAAHELYMFSLLVGSCLGGNLTPFGASANIAALGIIKREASRPMNFAEWLKTGGLFTILTTTASAGFLWFIWK